MLSRLFKRLKELIRTKMDLGAEQDIKSSNESKGIVNAVRDVFDGKKMDTNPTKELLNLSIGE